MAKAQHVHKLKRHRFKSGNLVYFCALPDCRFKIATALTLGKKCICWRCGNEFTMNEYSIRLAKPHCDDCHKPKKDLPEPIIQYDEMSDVTPKLFESIEQVIDAIEHNEIEENRKLDSINNIRTKLNVMTHPHLAAKPDDEEEI